MIFFQKFLFPSVPFSLSAFSLLSFPFFIPAPHAHTLFSLFPSLLLFRSLKSGCFDFQRTGPAKIEIIYKLEWNKKCPLLLLFVGELIQFCKWRKERGFVFFFVILKEIRF